jgi:hypothetical protein
MVAAALSIGALLGSLEGVHLLGIFREKENVYLGSFSWTQRTLKVKYGATWDFNKGQGSPELVSDYGSQSARL